MPRVKSVVTVIDDEGVVLAETNSEATFWAEEPPVEPPEPPPDEAPVLTLAGDAFVTVNEGDEWIEPGYSAVDVEDGDLTDQVVVTSNLDTAVPGTYTLYYSVQDSFGNAAAVERTVVVQPYVAPPLPPPGGTPSELWNPPEPPTEGIVTAFKTLDKTWKEVHAEIRGGGRIVVEPGHHILTPDDGYIYYSGWGELIIEGVLGPNGERPVIECQPNAEGKDIGNWVSYSATNGNLWIKNIIAKGAGQNMIAAGSGPKQTHRQDVVIDNCDLSYAGHHILMMAYEWSGRLVGDERLNPVNDHLWIRDTAMHHSGMTHVHYCDRIDHETVINSKFYNARGLSGHAFKAIPRTLNFVGNEVSNVNLDGSIDTDNSHRSFRPGNPADFYLGAVPVSIVGGQRGYFANNKITKRTKLGYNTGAYMVAMQMRHNIHGLEVPDPMNLASQFYDPVFWETAEDWSIRFENNQYIVLGDSADMPVQMIYLSQGTYPVHDGYPIQHLLPKSETPAGEPYLPEFWRERNRPFCTGDKVRGFTRQGMDLYRSMAYGNIPNPTDDDQPGGGRFTVETMPVEF